MGDDNQQSNIDPKARPDSNMAQADEEKKQPDGGVIFRAFKGFHPPTKLMSEVASPPYDVISSAEAREAVKDNEKSFLYVNKPEISLDPKTDPYSDEVYQMGRTQIDTFCKNGWLVQDEKPALYIYSQKMGDHEQFGLVGEASCQQYEDGVIKRHELTRKKKEDDRTKLTDVQSANVGPIFLCYKAVDEINALISTHVKANKPFADFTASDGVQHKLWILDNEDTTGTLMALFKDKVECSYVADGHHRTASAWRVYKERKAALEKEKKYTGDEDFHHFLAVMFPHDQLQILDYNRVLANFGTTHGDDKDGFLKAVAKDWDYEKVDQVEKTKEPNDFRMYIHGDGWYNLRPKKEMVEKVKDDVVKRLDVSLLADNLLTPIMGIGDMRSDPNISFLGGIHGLEGLKAKVDAKGKGVAFGLYHTTIEQLLDIADAQKLMPPKSTWFEPKLASGVVVRRF